MGAGMITGLVHVARPEGALDALADTLSALVTGVAAGLVGDAVVIVPVRDPEVATVVEATGATLVVAPDGADPWRAGAAAARRDWVFCLAAGDVPGEGWVRSLERFVVEEDRRGRGPAAIGRLRRGDGPLARLAARLRPARGPQAGDVLRRDELLVPRRGERARVRQLAIRIEPSGPT